MQITISRPDGSLIWQGLVPPRSCAIGFLTDDEGRLHCSVARDTIWPPWKVEILPTITERATIKVQKEEAVTLGSGLSRIQEGVLDIIFVLAGQIGIVWLAKRIPGRRLTRWAQEREDKAQ